MKFALISASFLALAHETLAAAHQKPPQPNRVCQQFDMPVPVSATNARYDIPRVDDNIGATNYALDSDTWSSPPPPRRVIENITIAILSQSTPGCALLDLRPPRTKKDVLQIATHGLVYDKRYWDSELHPDTYSYVEAAVNAGYSILTYDRLGTGLSVKPDAYTVVQSPLQLEILRKLTIVARNGDIFTLAKQSKSSKPEFQQIERASKVVHVGHSFGSILTSALLHSYGSISDAAILTGYNPDSKQEADKLRAAPFSLEFAKSDSASRFSDRPSGYIVPGPVSTIHTGFFQGLPSDAVGGFTEEMLNYAEAIKQPFTVGEWTSGAAVNQGYAPAFKGPIQFMEAEFDFPGCNGDCKGSYDEAMLKQLYPNATAVEVFIQPNTGHGLTLHRNATAGYQATFDFLDAHGL